MTSAPDMSSESSVSPETDDPGAVDKPSRRVIFRDLLIFQFKLWLDGLKDIVLSPLSILGFALDFFFGAAMKGSVFYKVLKLGERYDLWLNLFGAAEKAEKSREGFLDPRVEDDRASLDDILRRHAPGPTPASQIETQLGASVKEVVPDEEIVAEKESPSANPKPRQRS